MPNACGCVWRLFSFLPFLCGLTACSGYNSAAVEGVKLAISGQTLPDLAAIALKPEYIYLEVHAPNAQSLMVLAYEDKPGNQPPIDTWMSGKGEAFRTQAGLVASSGGMPGFWQNAKYTFNTQGQPIAVEFDLPSYQLYGVHLDITRLGKPTEEFTPLMRRAAKVPGLQFELMQGNWKNPPAQPPEGINLKRLRFVVGFNPANRVPVYGSSCLQANYCVEYLLRTAAQNL